MRAKLVVRRLGDGIPDCRQNLAIDVGGFVEQREKRLSIVCHDGVTLLMIGTRGRCVPWKTLPSVLLRWGFYT